MTYEFLGDADKDLILIVKVDAAKDVVSVVLPQGRVQIFAIEHTDKITSAKIFGKTVVF